MPTAEETLAERIRSSVAAGVSAAAESLSQVLELAVQMEMGDASPWQSDAPPAQWNADGVVFLWQVDGAGALLLFPESAGLFPSPDEGGKWSEDASRRMTRLAKALAEALGGKPPAVETAQAFYVSPLLSVVTCAEVSPATVQISLELRLEESTAQAYVLGPIANPDDVGRNVGAGPSPPAPQVTDPPPPPRESDELARAADDFALRLKRLPPYARSLLKINVPISVTLASKKERLSQVQRLVPGSIIQFDKSCDELLQLEAASRTVAWGEAVKVGDSFGLRVTSMHLPEERFRPVGRRAKP